MATEVKSHGEYTVGWICALPKEQTAAMAMLDQRHADLDKPPNDHNAYTLGSIGEHNVVIACLPKGKIGTNSAATVATRMVDTFPSIKVGLMVGIGGGIPPTVRLGDVVVSAPVDEYPGVVQWDLGKAEKDGKFKRTGALNNPPSAMLTALTKLESIHEISGSKISQYIKEVEKKCPKLAPKYTSSNSLKDPFFTSEHDEDQKREDVRVQYGLIASGNQVIKDGEFRDSLNDSFGGNILCVEMEAAGLMNDFPCIVIRGICDYADSQKNKDWQEYAAMIAAGYAKELLEYVRPTDVYAERPLRDLLHNTNAKIENIESKLEKGEDLAILKWISSLDYASQQSDFINRRQPGTGQWLIDSPEYQRWLSTPSQTLFCPGIPGAGKTIMSSIVINDLMGRAANDPNIAVAYIYCDFRRESEQRINDLLRSLIKQLLRGRSFLPDFVKDVYNQAKKNGTSLLLDDISRILERVSALYSQVFLVIDALDECQASDGCRSDLLSQIFKLQASTGANLFTTSRHIPDVEQHFNDCITQEIIARNDDVGKYLEGHMSYLPKFVIENPELQENIKDKIVQAAEGMFLLAQLYFDSLKDKTSKREINDMLKEFKKRQNREPGNNRRRELLNSAYDEAMERINSQMGDMKRLGRKVLAWITCAKRPLTTLELQHGLAVEIGDTDLDEDNIRDLNMIKSVCGGLVIVDEEGGFIRLVHYTTQEYFDTRHESLFQDEKVNFAIACVTYLSFNRFRGGFGGDIELRYKLARNPFYRYAAQNWGYHARDAALQNDELIISLLMDDAKVLLISQLILDPNRPWNRFYDRSGNVLGYGSGIHVAAWFGLGEAVMTLIKRGQDPNINDSYGRTALSYAAQRGHTELVRLLLAEESIDPNSRNECIDGTFRGWFLNKDWIEHLIEGSWGLGYCTGTPLHYAAWDGRDELVRILLEDPRVEPNARDYIFGATPLWCASRNGYETTVKRILEKPGVDPDCRNNKGDRMSPLVVAAWRGHTAVVKLLLATEGVDPNSQDSHRQTPLRIAMQQHHHEVVKVLLEDGRIDPYVRDVKGFTGLGLAIVKEHRTKVEILLSKGENIDLTANIGTTFSGISALQLAAKKGKGYMVRPLLENKHVVDLTDDLGSTALMFAVKNREKVVKTLLSAEGVDPNYRRAITKETALHLAVEKHHSAIISVLLINGAIDPNPKDDYGMTPLMRAAKNGKIKILGVITVWCC